MLNTIINPCQKTIVNGFLGCHSYYNLIHIVFDFLILLLSNLCIIERKRLFRITGMEKLHGFLMTSSFQSDSIILYREKLIRI